MRVHKGFTLIELLVVIAIIALLSSLAIVSVSGARNKANDAKIKSDLAQIRNQAAVDFSDSGDYSTMTIDSVKFGAPACSSGGYQINKLVAGYAVYADLCAGAGYFCVDSSGVATSVAAALVANDITCN